MLKVEVCVYACILLLAANAKGDLHEFICQKISWYTHWLETNGYDPSPVAVGPDHLTYEDSNLALEWDLTNHRISGHSYALNLVNISGDLTSTPKYLNAEWVLFGYIEFYGNYSANGSVGSPKQPISGQGEWRITLSPLDQSTNYIYFEETPSGYLNVTSVNIGGIFSSFSRSAHYYENLMESEAAADWERYIMRAMFERFINYLNSNPENPSYPLKTLYVDYWNEILSQTTLQDIIDTNQTAPPCWPFQSYNNFEHQ